VLLEQALAGLPELRLDLVGGQRVGQPGRVLRQACGGLWFGVCVRVVDGLSSGRRQSKRASDQHTHTHIHAHVNTHT
jgi:hypothetical protein